MICDNTLFQLEVILEQIMEFEYSGKRVYYTIQIRRKGRYELYDFVIRSMQGAKGFSDKIELLKERPDITALRILLYENYGSRNPVYESDVLDWNECERGETEPITVSGLGNVNTNTNPYVEEIARLKAENERLVIDRDHTLVLMEKHFEVLLLEKSLESQRLENERLRSELGQSRQFKELAESLIKESEKTSEPKTGLGAIPIERIVTPALEYGLQLSVQEAFRRLSGKEPPPYRPETQNTIKEPSPNFGELPVEEL